MRKLVLTACLSFAVLAVPAQSKPSSEPSILEVALSVNQATGEFSTLIAAVQEVGLTGVLDAKRHLTVFAPTDAAFAELGLDASNIATVPAADLAQILLYHVSPGDRFAKTVASSKRIRMLNKGFTFPSATSAGVFVNDAQVVSADIDCRNGVVHVIDKVLMP